MIGSLYTGISGLNANVTAMSVIGDNIANVNTTAFKSNRASFQNVLSQSLTGSDSNSIGRGVNMSGTSASWSQGTFETTNNGTDLAINGKGFFMVQDSAGLNYYTRDGGFYFDADGNLVNSDGFTVQGYAVDTVDTDGTFTLGSLGDICITGSTSAPSATTKMATTLNLDADAEVGDIFNTTITLFDSLGGEVPVTIEFTNTGPGAWGWAATVPATVGTCASTGAITFDANGDLATPGANPTIDITALINGANDVSTTWEFLDDTGATDGSITGYASPSITTFLNQNGYTAGSLQGASVDEDGVVTGLFSNGEIPPLFQLCLADFPNYQGLQGIGKNLYAQSRESGQATPGVPGTGRLGLISPSTLEMSNVDLAQEFVKMITTQRAFQANSKVITTSDEILSDLINIKR